MRSLISEEKDIGEACSVVGREERSMRDFGRKT
jgi:hypothetical protein